MHLSVKQFIDDVPDGVFRDKTILEVGSLDINGSAKPIVMSHNPASYLGTDFMDGPRVDQVVDCEDLVKTFGENSFDTIVCCEMLEHAEHWRNCINNMKQVAKEFIVITTRGPGFGLHDYPSDYWRYTVEDMEKIFADWRVIWVEADPQAPGVFLYAQKLSNDPPIDLSGIELEKAPRE